MMPTRRVGSYGFELVPIVHVAHMACTAPGFASRMPFPIPLTGTMTVNGNHRQVYSGVCPHCGALVDVDEDFIEVPE